MSAAAEEHRQWLARRKRIVEENFPDICTCYFGKVYMQAVKPCKNCQVCPGCTSHIKNECWRDHALACRALKDLEEENGRLVETVRTA